MLPGPKRSTIALRILTSRCSFLSLRVVSTRLRNLDEQAKKFVAELSPSYMTARKALRELRAQFDHLPMPSLPHRPNLALREDREALQQWKNYLAYEEANPLDIEEPPALQTRVAFAYKKAVAFVRFYPEIWCAVVSPSVGGCALTSASPVVRQASLRKLPPQAGKNGRRTLIFPSGYRRQSVQVSLSPSSLCYDHALTIESTRQSTLVVHPGRTRGDASRLACRTRNIRCFD